MDTDVLFPFPCVHVLLFARKMASLKSDGANLNVHSAWSSMPFKFPHKALKSSFVHESPLRLSHRRWRCEILHAQKLVTE